MGWREVGKGTNQMTIATQQNSNQDSWCVYLLKCGDGTQYCGISTDVNARLGAHNSSSTGAKYTRSRRPCTLLAVSGPYTHSNALKLEYRVKQQSAKKKLKYLQDCVDFY